MTEQEAQTLRTMDKFDKIGAAGVVELLQKPFEDFGANLTKEQAEIIGFFVSLRGVDNRETISNLVNLFSPNRRLPARLDLLDLLEATPHDEHGDWLGYYLALPANKDQTWGRGGRPANVAWMLDDMVRLVFQTFTRPSN